MIKEDLEERFGDKWEIHAFLMIGVAASRRQRRLTTAEVASGMVHVLLAANLEELGDKLVAQPDSRTPPVITNHKPVISRAPFNGLPPVAGHVPPWSCR